MHCGCGSWGSWGSWGGPVSEDGGLFQGAGGHEGGRPLPEGVHVDYALTNTADLVYLQTAGGLVVFSPSRPDEFAARLRDRLARAGPS